MLLLFEEFLQNSLKICCGDYFEFFHFDTIMSTFNVKWGTDYMRIPENTSGDNVCTLVSFEKAK